jgi:hypothetical protein
MKHLIGVALLSLVSVVLLGGCGAAHLSDEYGIRTRTAMAKQAAKNQAENVDEIDAIDARRTLDAHYTAGTQQRQVVPTPTPVIAVPRNEAN